MNDLEITQDKLQATVLEKAAFSSKRMAAISSRLRHVTKMMSMLNAPPCDGEFLIVVQNDEAQLYYPLKGENNTIGRSHSNSLSLPDDNVSREHCTISRSSDCWIIRDNGSKNGFGINGQRVEEKTLVDGDLIAIGAYELIFTVSRSN